MSICINNVWEEFSIPLKNFIKKRIHHEQDTEDILQEVFFKIHNSMESLSNSSKIHAWVYKIARNAIVDFYRKNNKFSELTELPDELVSEPDIDFSANSEIALCLKAMINNLPDIYKEAIWLTEFQNLTQKELGEKLGLSPSGAKSRVQRARAMLKEMLLGCCQLEFDRLGNIIDYKHRKTDCKYC